MSILEHGMDEKYSIVEREKTMYLQLPIINFEVPFKLGPSGVIVL